MWILRTGWYLARLGVYVGWAIVKYSVITSLTMLYVLGLVALLVWRNQEIRPELPAQPLPDPPKQSLKPRRATKQRRMGKSTRVRQNRPLRLSQGRSRADHSPQVRVELTRPGR